MSQPYKHETLSDTRDQFRLIRILPRNKKEPLDDFQITIETFFLDSAPEYKALSYEWGLIEDDPASIVVSSKEQIGTIPVRRNLLHFFETARDVHKLRTWLYIDQLCINQDAMEERAQQVMLMSQIYVNADEVVVWLGRSSSNPKKNGVSLPSIPGWLTSKISGIGASKTVDALTAIWSNSYWTRHWIIQEFALARERSIMIDQVSIGWRGLRAYTVDASDRKLLPERLVDTELKFRSIAMIKGNPDAGSAIAWNNAMGLAKTSLCSDPRDKVYGIQGVFEPKLRIKVSYEAKARQIFEEAVMLYAERFVVGRTHGFENFVMAVANLAKGMGLRDGQVPDELIFKRHEEKWPPDMICLLAEVSSYGKDSVGVAGLSDGQRGQLRKSIDCFIDMQVPSN